MRALAPSAVDALLRLHEAMGHKIIVFSESGAWGCGMMRLQGRRSHPCRGLVATVFALKLYAEKYKAVVMYGDTKMIERNTAIQAFKTPNSGASPLSR